MLLPGPCLSLQPYDLAIFPLTPWLLSAPAPHFGAPGELYLLLCCLPLSNINTLRGKMFSPLLPYSWHREQCLAYKMCSINMSNKCTNQSISNRLCSVYFLIESSLPSVEIKRKELLTSKFHGLDLHPNSIFC